MRTYKVARMTTGGCTEKETDYSPTEEDTSNDSFTGTNVCTGKPESEQEDQIEKNPRKRLRSFDTDHQNPSSNERKKKVTFSNCLVEKSPIHENEQSTSFNALKAEMRNKMDTLMDQIQADYNQKQDEFKKKEAEWAAEKNRLEQEILDKSVVNENLEKELSAVKADMRRGMDYLSGVTAVTEKMNSGGKNIISSFQKHLPKK